jgi:hypothetical protein
VHFLNQWRKCPQETGVDGGRQARLSTGYRIVSKSGGVSERGPSLPDLLRQHLVSSLASERRVHPFLLPCLLPGCTLDLKHPDFLPNQTRQGSEGSRPTFPEPHSHFQCLINWQILTG